MKNNRKNSVMENRNKGMIGMNSFVKSLVLVVVMGCLGWSLFGNGNKEQNANADIGIPEGEYQRNLIVSPKLEEELGSVRISFNLESNANEKYKYILFRNGDKYYNLADMTEVQAASIFTAINKTSDKLQDYSFQMSDDTIDNRITVSTMGKYYFREAANIASDISEMTEFDGNKIMLPVSYKKVANYELLFIHPNYDSELLELNYNIDFFDGESLIDLVNDNYSIYEKSYIILNNILEDDFKTFLTSVLCTTMMKRFESDINLENLRNINLNISAADKQKYRNSLGYSIRKHFNVQYETVDEVGIDEDNVYKVQFPYIDLAGKKSFDYLYGKHQNPYITLYLGYLFEKQKPLGAEVLAQRMKLTNPHIPENLQYDFSSYEPIADVESSKLGDLALRYLNWGVEYTLNSANTGIFNSTSSSESVLGIKLNDTTTVVDEWIKTYTENIDDYRAANYFKFTEGLKSLPEYFDFSMNQTAPKQIQILNNNFNTKRVEIFGQVNNRFTLSHIDAWTSRNLAWDYATSASLKQQGGDVINSSYLFNKNIFQNDSISTILRTDSEPVEVRMNLNSSQTIKAVGLLYAPVNATIDNNVEFVFNPDEINERVIEEGQEDLLSIDHISIDDISVYSYLGRGISNVIDGKRTEKESAPYYHYYYKFSNASTKSYLDPIFKFDKPYRISALNIYWRNLPKKNIIIQNKAGVVFANVSVTNLDSENMQKITFDQQRITDNIQIIIDGEDETAEIGIYEIEFFTTSNPKFKQYISYSHPDYCFKEINQFKKYKIEKNEPFYVYYIFDQPIDADEILFIDKNDTTNFGLYEMMLFSEDPIAYKSFSYIPKSLMSTIELDDQYDIPNASIYNKPEYLFFNTIADKRLELMNPEESSEGCFDSIKINLGIGAEDFKQIVLYDGSNMSADSVYFSEPVTALPGELNTGGFFYYNMTNQSDLVKTKIRNLNFQTPFYSDFSGGSEVKYYRGNPIPYSPFGIDSPRTFNYKMYKQYEAKTWLWNKKLPPSSQLLPSGVYELLRNQMKNKLSTPEMYTSLAIDSFGFENYNNNYMTEETLLSELKGISGLRINEKGEIELEESEYLTINDNTFTLSEAVSGFGNYSGITIKPFLPGRYYNKINNDKINSFLNIYQYDKSAGVDSLGMIGGILSMADINGIENEAFTSIYGIDISDELNKYYRMGSDAPGLDTKYEPAFFTQLSNEKSYKDANYRFNRSDLEKLTIIVPDLSTIRVGDLICNMKNAYDEPHIGIVVATLWETPAELAGLSADDIMTKIIVVSVSRGLQKSTLGVWGNQGNTFGGFAFNPKDYHVRRLLKKTKNENTIVSTQDELFQNYIEELECIVNLPDDKYLQVQGNGDAKNHWLSNTDEYLKGITIQLYAQDQDKQYLKLDDYGYDIQFFSPVDLNFKYSDLSDAQNIFTNKGDGIYYGARIGPGEDDYDWLAKATLKDKDDIDELYASFFANFVDPDDYNNLSESEKNAAKGRALIAFEKNFKELYEISYNLDYFNEQGVGVGYKLYVSGNGELRFESDDGLINTNQFGIKAFGNCRPGDDFLLSFGIVGFDKVRAVSEKKDFVAVYDKKMLWRANLYIDEGAGKDWNNFNPWNSPDNEWNFIYDGSQLAYDGTESNIQALEPGDGGQTVTFPDWTKYNEGIFQSAASTKVSGAVAYASLDVEPPFRFAWELTQQKESLITAWNSGNINNGLYTINDFNGSEAPGDNWNNYLGHSLSNIENNQDKTSQNYSMSYGNITFNNNDPKPYRPGLSAILVYDKKNYDLGAKWTSQSSGVDCGAFIGAAAAYNNRPYHGAILYEQNPMGTNDWLYPGKRATMDPGGLNLPWYSWDMGVDNLRKNTISDYKDGNLVFPFSICPGDIIVFDNHENENRSGNEYPHVSMVAYIKYNDDGNTTYNDIILIEAASGLRREYRVLNTQTLYQYIQSLYVAEFRYGEKLIYRRLRIY